MKQSFFDWHRLSLLTKNNRLMRYNSLCFQIFLNIHLKEWQLWFFPWFRGNSKSYKELSAIHRQHWHLSRETFDSKKCDSQSSTITSQSNIVAGADTSWQAYYVEHLSLIMSPILLHESLVQGTNIRYDMFTSASQPGSGAMSYLLI